MLPSALKMNPRPCIKFTTIRLMLNVFGQCCLFTFGCKVIKKGVTRKIWDMIIKEKYSVYICYLKRKQQFLMLNLHNELKIFFFCWKWFLVQTAKIIFHPWTLCKSAGDLTVPRDKQNLSLTTCFLFWCSCEENVRFCSVFRISKA